MTENEFYEMYENGELEFVEIEKSELYALSNLETRFYAITLLFEEACRAAPNRKAKKQCQQFVDLFKKQISDVGLDYAYENFLITGLTSEQIFTGEYDMRSEKNGREA